MTTTTQNLGSLSVGFLSITNIIDTETDTGTTNSFLASGPFVLTNTDIFGLSGVSFQAFGAGVSGPNSVETNVFTYKVASTSATQLINAMDMSFQVDLLAGLASANTFSAIEQAFDTAGNLIATQTISATSPAAVPLVFTQGYSSINVRITWTMAISNAGSAVSAISSSGAYQNFGTIATSQLCSIGDIVFLDTNHDGLEDAGFDGGPGVAGVTVELLDSTGTTVLATTTTNAAGRYSFNNLMAGTYRVEFVTPNGYAFTTQGVGTNAGINSGADQLTGISGPITLTAGQAYHNAEAGLVLTGTGGGGGGNGGISVEKIPCKVVVNACGQISYTFAVTNTGSAALSNVTISDNIGTAAAPRLTTPTAVLVSGFNVGDANHNGALDVGETWQYSEVVNQISCNSGSSGSICHTVTGTNLGSGCTAWLSTSFKPTNCHDGATYVFQGVKCTIAGGGVGSTPIVEQCGDSIVEFSKDCHQATTHYDTARDCWVTTVPADSNPGSVFCTGIPVQVPAGCNLSGASCTWSVDDASNNCGSTSVNWNGSCQGYKSSIANGSDGCDDYNAIGVKVCDNQTSYGNGGCTDQGYGWNNGGYCQSDNYAQNQSNWIGSGSDCAGTAENLHTSTNCGNNGSTQGGSCHFTANDSNLGAGKVAWLSSTFTPKSCTDGDVYTFKGITCTIAQSGKPTITQTMPDSTVQFSANCTQATTHYDSVNKIWVTVLPAGTNPGTVFMTGMPMTVPSGYNLSGATIGWTVGQSVNNCGTSSLTWGASCQGYASFNQNGHNGDIDYNQIGVKVCDSSADYGCGGNIDDNGYGWNGACNSGGYQTCNGWGWNSSSSYTCNGWNGSSGDSAGVAENMNNNNNCNSSSDYNCGGYSSYSGYNCYGYYGDCGTNYGCGDNYYGYNNCGSSSGSGSLCEGQIGQGSGCGTLGEITTGIAGAADTVTVTAKTAAGATVTATDTAEVMIVNNSTNVTVDGTATTASLASVYGGARTLEFTYNASNILALKQIQNGMANVTGSNTASQAFVVIGNKSVPYATGATTYFQGTVTNGETIFADATLNSLTNTPVAAANAHFDTTAGASVYAYVFASQAAFLAGQAPLQSISYNSSGSQAMHLGDQVGSLTLTGYVGSNGGHLTSGGSLVTNDTVMLCVSEDAYQGDAQFRLTVDGAQYGDIMSTSALHATGDANCFLLTGNWGTGPHQIGISFINDAYGGTSSTDRNLYVNSVGYDGTTYAGTSATLCSNGTSTFTVGGSTATAATPADVLTLALSEDAYQGDAQFILFLDGKQVTTAQSVSALHGSGQSQSITYSGNFGAGSHTVGVQFINDAYGGTSSTDRNLYVAAIGLNGSTVSGASASLFSNGTANFAIATLH